MAKIIHNKLIRDKIPEILRRKQVLFELKQLTENVEFEQALRGKLVEEAAEVAATLDHEALVTELADVAEVVKSLCVLKGITAEEIERARAQKFTERGGFDERTWLMWSDETEKK
ncbi:MAG: nucleoside triphosphate pyrophosphohydrolase [Patescibacteria group bacterium]